jgi:peptide/nickel transport system permease protein
VDFARVVRGETMSVSGRDYVLAARAVGASHGRMIVRHVLPNVVSPVIVIATFAVAQLIVAEASLSFLGVGVQPPTPTWGGMLADARGYLRTAWWMATFPGLAIMLTVLAVNFIGDWVRDVLDPRISD